MIFLDNNSTTKLDERVFEKMVPFLKENYGNPHSNFHNFGLISKKAVENSRNNIADIFNVNSENVIFTSGATESNNLILKGLAYKAIENSSSRKKIFCSSIEHEDLPKVVYRSKEPTAKLSNALFIQAYRRTGQEKVVRTTYRSSERCI